jgi:protein involved in polysaccharide export with SLBB domain
MWASGQLPVQGGGEVGQTGQAGAAAQSPPASPADKIAALRESHTSMADDAAATIAAAMAAAGGAGSAAGLTRRQIREAERAAADALRAQADRTGEIPPWDSFGGPGLIPPVEMQVREEPGR